VVARETKARNSLRRHPEQRAQSKFWPKSPERSALH
jgi:hypothetical protein